MQRGGKCLLPVFSAGRAEELLFILDEFWDENLEELKNIRIYYTIELIEKCKKIYEIYINMLSEKIRDRFYKGVVIIFLCSEIHFNTNIFTTYVQRRKSNTKIITPWLLCALQACFKMANRELCSKGGVMMIEMGLLSLAIVLRGV